MTGRAHDAHDVNYDLLLAQIVDLKDRLRRAIAIARAEIESGTGLYTRAHLAELDALEKSL